MNFDEARGLEFSFRRYYDQYTYERGIRFHLLLLFHNCGARPLTPANKQLTTSFLLLKLGAFVLVNCSVTAAAADDDEVTLEIRLR